MVDAVGTTKYTYIAGGQLYTEDLSSPGYGKAGGPWSNDTVTNTYANRLRTKLDFHPMRYQAMRRRRSTSASRAGGRRFTSARSALSHGVKQPTGVWTNNFGYDTAGRVLVLEAKIPHTAKLANHRGLRLKPNPTRFPSDRSPLLVPLRCRVHCQTLGALFLVDDNAAGVF